MEPDDFTKLAERQLVALAATGYAHDVLGAVNPADVWDLRLASILAASATLLESGEPVSMQSLWDQLTGDARNVLLELSDVDSYQENIPRLANRVRAASLEREIRSVGRQLQSLDDIPDALDRLTALQSGDTGSSRLATASMSATDFAQLEIPRPASLMGDNLLTAGGFSILYGRPGSAKTWVALHQAICLARGIPWFGLDTPRAGTRVGFIELELGAYTMQQRLRALGIGSDPMDRNLVLACRPHLKGAFDLIQPAERADLRKWIVNEGLQVVMIDALSRAQSASETDPMEMLPMLLGFDSLRHETGCAVQLLHHERKGLAGGKADDDMDALRGHSKLQSDPTLLMRIKLLPGSKMRVITFPKVSEAGTPDPLHFALDDETGVPISCTPPTTESKTEKAHARIMEFVSSLGRPAGRREIENHLGLPERTIRRHLNDLVDVQKLVTYGKGPNMVYSESGHPAKSGQNDVAGFVTDYETNGLHGF